MQDNAASVNQILQRTRRSLRNAQLALTDLKNTQDPERRIAALHNVVVTGRAVTNVLQKLRSRVEGFDDWYQPWEDEMRNDPLMRYMYRLRSSILKEGDDQTSDNLYIHHLNYPQDLPPTPPNAVYFFMGDEIGGIGWEVQLEDGSTAKIYAAMPEQIARTWLEFQDLPNEHQGSSLEDRSVEHVCSLYLAISNGWYGLLKLSSAESDPRIRS